MASHTKVYVDSRYRLSGEHNNFVVQLPEQITTAHGTLCHVTDISLAVSWQTITARNDQVYWLELTGMGGPNPTRYARALSIPHGTYNAVTLATALQDALNSTGTQATQPYQVTYDQLQNKLTVSNSSVHFKPVGDAHLTDPTWKIQNWSGVAGAPDYDVLEPRSANAVLGIVPAEDVNWALSWRSTIVNVQVLDSVYLCSETLASHKTMGPTGSRSIIRRINVANVFGSAVQAENFSGLAADSIEMQGRVFRQIDFSLRDAGGRVVDTQGQPLSFALVFSER